MSSNLPNQDLPRPARFILHPTDFSESSQLAFAHALRLAISNEANLSLLHVGKDSHHGWELFPPIRGTLESWGLLESGTRRSQLRDQLGIGIEKVIAEDRDVVEAIRGFFDRRPIDFMVLATSGRDGLASWLKPSTAEKIAHRVSVPTLFVPANCHGCVDPKTGTVTMKHVLVPVDHQPRADAAVARGLRAISVYGGDQADLTLLHVGDSTFPDVDLPDGDWNVRYSTRGGDPAAGILGAADELEANLVVMVTEGSHGFFDVLRGSTTDQVLRHSRCPVLAIPAT
jgi:nucleotide-binding universal stress UspA family protein